jgi:hypothetical protein
MKNTVTEANLYGDVICLGFTVSPVLVPERIGSVLHGFTEQNSNIATEGIHQNSRVKLF